MIDIEIAQHFISLTDLDEEIKIRRQLIKEMVGTLYPRIVEGEIYLLVMQREKIRRIVDSNKIKV